MRISDTEAKEAFTIVELLFMVAICALLAVLLLAGMGHIRDIARRSACQQTLRKLHVALTSYATDHNQCLPAGFATSQAWVARVADYLSTPTTKTAGDAYCPSTRPNHPDYLYKRDRATWRTDYNANSKVLSSVEENNRLPLIASSAVLLYDGGGGVRASAGDAKETARHLGAFNVLYVGGHVEAIRKFDPALQRWER